MDWVHLHYCHFQTYVFLQHLPVYMVTFILKLCRAVLLLHCIAKFKSDISICLYARVGQRFSEWRDNFIWAFNQSMLYYNMVYWGLDVHCMKYLTAIFAQTGNNNNCVFEIQVFPTWWMHKSPDGYRNLCVFLCMNFHFVLVNVIWLLTK